jgi:hypothetical protein
MNYSPFEWANKSMVLGICIHPTHSFEEIIIPRTDARLICVPGPFVGLRRRTRLAP